MMGVHSIGSEEGAVVAAEAHRELLISGTEWDAFMDDFHQTLAKFGVPERERGDLDAIVESTKDDILATSAAPAVSQ
jgi:hypothetical protein